MSADGTSMECSIATFLLRRMKEIGCDHIFGVPGDFSLGLLNEVLKSDVAYIGTCNELNAAYAADGYARIKGIGALTTTYTVGELSAINGVAGSFAENIPVIKLSGVPATKFYKTAPLLHHTLGDYEISLKMYEHITVAQTVLSKPHKAASEIDRVLKACLLQKQPVYIGVPADMVNMIIRCPVAPFSIPKERASDPHVLEEAVLEAVRMISMSKKPLFLPGLIVNRFNMEQEMMKLIETSGIPFATTMLSKAMFNEDHPQFIGLYSGDRCRKYVKERVESSDCIIMCGEKLTDFNTGGFSAVLDRRTTIEVNRDSARIMFHTYHGINIRDFIRELTSRISFRHAKNLNICPALNVCTHRASAEYIPETSKPLTMKRLFDRVSKYLEPNSIVIAETGASLFSAAEVLMPRGTKFIGQTFYGSIGFTIGATLGACIADPARPVVLFIGDGSFQVTCQDMSTMIRYGCKPTIFLVNNDGYTIERVITDRIYNNIQPWKYHKLTGVFGGGESHQCRTEGQLETALTIIKATGGFNFLEVFLDRWDCNDALRRAGRSMALNNGLLEIDEAAQALKEVRHHYDDDDDFEENDDTDVVQSPKH